MTSVGRKHWVVRCEGNLGCIRLTPDNRELVTEELGGLWGLEHEHNRGIPR